MHTVAHTLVMTFEHEAFHVETCSSPEGGVRPQACAARRGARTTRVPAGKVVLGHMDSKADRQSRKGGILRRCAGMF